jgi:hypothetical protein
MIEILMKKDRTMQELKFMKKAIENFTWYKSNQNIFEKGQSTK